MMPTNTNTSAERPWHEQLRDEFPASVVGTLPRNLVKDDRDRGQCAAGVRNRAGQPISADNVYCGGYHARSIHLSYVGHAAVTDRLLSVDPEWTWEPMALDPQGLPALDRNGNLWIKLTVHGVTRIGVGDGKNLKELIGDALRNAAMRFGVALSLWTKEELESERPVNTDTLPGAEQVSHPESRPADGRVSADQFRGLTAEWVKAGWAKDQLLGWLSETLGRPIKRGGDLTAADLAAVLDTIPVNDERTATPA